MSIPKLFAGSLLVAAAFFLGRGIDALDAQGRSGPPPRTPPPPPPSNPPSGGEEAPGLLVYGEDGGQSAAANGFLAVTGSYGVGTSVLYLIDTNTKQLAVYEARGGSRSMRRLVLVGARRIDLDLQLQGYNDESEFSYAELRERFDEGGIRPAAPETPTGLGRSGGR